MPPVASPHVHDNSHQRCGRRPLVRSCLAYSSGWKCSSTTQSCRALHHFQARDTYRRCLPSTGCRRRVDQGR
jgi:hypothetical protein